MANLSAPRTELPSFFKELGDAARIIAPVSATNAHLFTTMANTFEALSRDPQALQGHDRQEPVDAAGRHLVAARAAPVPRAHRRALARSRHGRQRAARRAAHGQLARCASAPRSSGARSRSTTTSRARSARSRTSSRRRPPIGALRGLTATVGTLQPQVRFLGPFVTVCNTWNQFWTFAAEHFSAPDDTGSSERALLNMAAGQPGPTPSGPRAPTSSPTARARCPAAPSSTCTTTSTARPSTSTATPTAARARPATSRPTTRCATRASRATPTRAP